MRNIVVTGANCFIARPLIDKLLKKGYFIYAVVRNVANYNNANKNIQYIEADLQDYDKLPDLINTNCYAMFHFAWNGTRGSTRTDDILQEQNYLNSVKALHAASKLGCKVFVGAGSQAEYGVLDKVISEDDLPRPNTAYGIYKLRFTEYALNMQNELKMNVIIPRFFSLYGEGDYSGTLIESSIDKMLKNETCDFSRATQNWNYMYIDDCVSALIHLLENNGTGIYNFGTLDTRVLKDYILEIKEIIGSSSELNFGAIPDPKTGLVSISPNINKLIAAGFTKFTPFEQGIKNIIDYKRKGL